MIPTFGSVSSENLVCAVLIMDDDLVLNLELDAGPSTYSGGAAKKGGRWTDRYMVFTG